MQVTSKTALQNAGSFRLVRDWTRGISRTRGPGRIATAASLGSSRTGVPDRIPQNPARHAAGAVLDRRKPITDLEWLRASTGERFSLAAPVTACICGPRDQFTRAAFRCLRASSGAYFDGLTGQGSHNAHHSPSGGARQRRPANTSCSFIRRPSAPRGMRPQTIVDPEAAHGMEQQLIHSLVGACRRAEVKTPRDQVGVRTLSPTWRNCSKASPNIMPT